MQINVLAPMMLALLMLPKLKQSGRGRVVFVSSSLHKPGKGFDGSEDVDFRMDDPELALPGAYQVGKAYRNSKLAVIWVMLELHRRFHAQTGVSFTAVCPGFVPVTASKHATSRMQWFVLRFILTRFSFTTSVVDAATSLAFMSVAEEVFQQSGKYFSAMQVEPPSDDALNESRAAAFYAYALRRLGPFWKEASAGLDVVGERVV